MSHSRYGFGGSPAQLVAAVNRDGKLPMGHPSGSTVQIDFADNAAVQSSFETGDAGHVLHNVITAFDPASVTGKRQRQSAQDGPRKR
eukprot:COSAG01_NODE_43379_length_430_cov_1.060423_1_plen_87_part_00